MSILCCPWPVQPLSASLNTGFSLNSFYFSFFWYLPFFPNNLYRIATTCGSPIFWPENWSLHAVSFLEHSGNFTKLVASVSAWIHLPQAQGYSRPTSSLLMQVRHYRERTVLSLLVSTYKAVVSLDVLGKVLLLVSFISLVNIVMLLAGSPGDD